MMKSLLALRTPIAIGALGALIFGLWTNWSSEGWGLYLFVAGYAAVVSAIMAWRLSREEDSFGGAAVIEFSPRVMLARDILVFAGLLGGIAMPLRSGVVHGLFVVGAIAMGSNLVFRFLKMGRKRWWS